MRRAARFGARASCDDVGSASEKLQGQVLRQPLGTGELGGGAGNREAPIGTGAEQRRDRVPLQANAFIDREEVALRCGLPRLDLTHTRQGLETEIVPLAEQGHGLGSNRQRLRGVVPQGVQMHQPGVGRSHRGREDQAGLRHFDLRGPLLGDCCSQCRAVLAPEIQFPGQIHRGHPVVVPALGQRGFRDEVVVALLLLRESGRAGHLRNERGMRALHLSHRRVQPRPGEVEVRGTARAPPR